jgi:RNA polymerase sigma factor (sigma-70 family)
MRSVWRKQQRAALDADDQRIPDERLIDRVRSGDSQAFGELYRRHRPAAESTARWLLHSRSEADDVVADAFAGVLSAIRNGNGPLDNFRSYLLAAVRNGCRARRRRVVTADAPRADAGKTPMFEDPERYVEADTVARAFASLNPRWQQTLWLTEVEQRSPAEVAAVMELAPNATAALTLRAREAFATAYLAEHVNASSDAACERHGRRLAAYVRDQLTYNQSEEVERHLLQCRRCQQAVDELRDVNASLRKLVPPVGSALAAQWTVGTTFVGTVSNLFSSGLLLKGAAAVLIATPLLVNILGGFGRGGTPDDAEVRTVVAAPEEPEVESNPVDVTRPIRQPGTVSGPASSGLVGTTTTTIPPKESPESPAAGLSGADEPTSVNRPIAEVPGAVQPPIVPPAPDEDENPVIDHVVNPVVGGVVVPVIEGVVVPIVEDVVIPVVEPIVDGVVVPVVEDVVVPIVEPVVEEVVAPVVDEVVVPVVEPVVEEVVAPVVAPVVDEVVVPVVEPVVEEVVAPVVAPVVEPVVDEVVAPVVEPVVEVVAPVVEPVLEPVVEVVAPVVEPIPGLSLLG